LTRFIIPSTDPRLKRHINHDERSRRYPWRERSRLLSSVRHPRRIPVLDQGNLGSCTGNAGIGCMGTDPFYATVQAPKFTENEPGAVALYSAATVADDYPGQYPPDDTGSDGLSIAKVLTASGEISGYQHALSLAAMLDALQTYPVIVGINWYEDMFSPSASGVVSITGALAGGHEIVADEYDAARSLIGFTNSWGLAFGVAGRFYITTKDMATLLGQGGDVTVFTPRTLPAPVPVPPGPAPAASDADRRLMASLPSGWLSGHHIGGNAQVQAALKRFKADTGQ
jgi:hypothetical protein